MITHLEKAAARKVRFRVKKTWIITLWENLPPRKSKLQFLIELHPFWMLQGTFHARFGHCPMKSWTKQTQLVAMFSLHWQQHFELPRCGTPAQHLSLQQRMPTCWDQKKDHSLGSGLVDQHPEASKKSPFEDNLENNENKSMGLGEQLGTWKQLEWPRVRPMLRFTHRLFHKFGCCVFFIY